jgi:hypothetical protein
MRLKVTHPEKPRAQKSSHRSRTHRSWVRRAILYLWSEWRAELFVGILVAVAIFLLVEQMQIRQTLLRWLRQGAQAMSSLGGGILQGLVDSVRSTTPSDLTGYALLLIALALVAWRTRWRLTTMPRFTMRKCPHCGGSLHRIRRRLRDRMVSVLVPVRRYQCKNPDCQWRGLRAGTERSV